MVLHFVKILTTKLSWITRNIFIEIYLQLYKFLVFKNEENGFHLYGDDDIRGTSHQEFPLGGEFVLLNEYENYINLRGQCSSTQNLRKLFGILFM